jgi:predicted ATP-dependent Lon-type protease
MVSANRVFVAGGMPTDTYVHRRHLGLEDRLRSELFSGYQIVCVTGPTKSGKSVLCKAILADKKSIWLHGGQISDETEFWQQAASKLQVVNETATSIEIKGVGGLKERLKYLSFFA